MDPLIKCYNFLTSTRAKKVILFLDEHFRLHAVKVPLLKYLVYLRSYDQIIEELKETTNKLKKTRYGILYKVKEEEEQGDKQIGKEVREWIEEVSIIISEYENFTYEAWKQNDLAAYDLPTSGYLPKVGIRVPLSEEAFNIASKVKDLLERANHDSFSYWLAPPDVVDYFDNINCECFPSREETMEKVKKALNNPDVRVIGLYGPSGVGKTTLVKEIARQVFEGSQEEGKIFDVVAMANVTRYPDIRKIQGKIADSLGMKLDEESDIVRAGLIRKRLKNEKESTLIILDDIWAELDFSMLGVPLALVGGDGNWEEGRSKAYCKGCKVLLISESKQVLLSQMEGKIDSIYSLDVLRENEAEMLFKRMAGIDKNSEVVKLATQIASKCNGLPMLIVTTARALKDRRRLVWEDALQQFERGKLTVASEFSTILSYGLLENEELKDVFLLCARMGPDTLIMDLVKYCIGLGFLQEVYSVKETRDRVYALVGKLKLSGLLYDSYSSDHFTMSDIVRSAALSIASKEKHVFTMTKGKIDDWPDVDNLVMYEAISLHHCDIIDGFLSHINFRKLRLFHVNNSDPRLVIPGKLFKGMKELKVLILTGFNLSPLPSSIGCLTKLGMLCLEYCKLGDGLSIIGKFKKLRVLSFSGSDIEKLPVELKHLTKLQLLDISNCSKLEKIPSNVISSLISLEELCMRNTFIQWEFEGQTNQSEKASLSELGHLNQLTNLDIQIPNASLLPKNMFFDKLSSYKIVIGDLNADTVMDFKVPGKYEASKYLAIQLKEGFDVHSRKGVKMLFDTVEHLFLEDLDGVDDLFYSLNLKGFPHLKHLLIAYNSNIQYLIGSKERQHFEKVFPRLESLHLYNLKDLHNMCSFELSAPSFGYLKLIKINLCDKLKQVFLFSMISLLTVLETIDVSECNALEKIVTLEGESNTNEMRLVKFPELCSLTLLSLPKLIGFYPIQLIGREATELFHEKVEVPKLERMVLSSLQIDKIWGRQSSLRPCFQNLIHLDVNGCWNLTYLISIAMARNLVNLQSLFVSECDKMRRIFVHDRAWSRSVPEDSIFPNLKTMKLSCLKSLNEIWNPGFFSNSFGKLDTLIVEECYMLVNVFACYMEAIFHSLRNLRVTNCNSMRAVFVLRGQRYGRNSTNLQDVWLETLPNLDHIWRNDRNDIKLNNLQNMVVHDCGRLKYIFPFSKAKCLHKLEYLKIAGCFQLREIVDSVSSRGQPLKFRNLTTIKFSKLPRLAWFYRGQNKSSCPALNHLSIELCDNLDLFRNELTVAPTLFSKEVINELKSMQIDSLHAQSLSHYTINLEEFGLSRLANPEIIYYFLHRSPNLKSLSLNNCSFTEIVPLQIPPEFEKSGVVSKLKRLKLIDLPRLEIIGFDRDIILQRIEFLILRNCPCLVNMVSSSVSLTHLTILEVVSCDGLKTLVPQLVAKSLVQLKIMKVIKCQSMVEIVESGEENAREVVIIFRQLKVLELVSLEKLNCFSKGSVFEFPSLEKLVVSACPKMEIFCKEVNSAPFLQKVFLEHEKENIWCWRQNLNTTIQEIFLEKKFFEVMDEISLSEHHDLQKLWKNGAGGLRNSWFYNLKTLRLEDCERLLCAIPYNIFLCLKSLKELEVRNCNKVEVIFEKENDNGAIQPQLRSLTLVGLSKLKHVWEKGNIMFQNLLHVSVSDCEVLDTLFPVAIAKNIKKLEKLEINSCQNLLEIVRKEDVSEDVAEQFVFPCLTLLGLNDLPKLIYFYCEKFTVKCPELRKLEVLACPKFELFQSERLEREGEGSGTSIYIQPLFTNLQDIYFLEELSVDWIHSSALSSSLLLNKDLRLKCLNEIRLFFDVDDKENPTVPSEILDKAPNLQHMTIGRCKSLGIFQNLNLKISEQLKILALHRVSELKFIWLNIIFKKLYCLDVVSCPHLIKLFDSRSAVSFSALTVLYISGCLGLEYLFTSSVAKVLIHLELIIVKESPSIKEIVKVDQDGITCQELEFKKLHTIDLDSLSSLEYFYSGNGTLKLPALALVHIERCPKMKIFSRGHINAESFRGIYNSFQQNDESFFHKGLNGSVKVLFLLQMLSKGMDGTEFFKHSDLRDAWKDGLSIQNNWMYTLKTLKLVNCDIEQYAIPSKLFPCLKSLKRLEVRSCNKVENIFANNDTEAIPSQLSTLILEDLSELTLVWEKNFQGILGFQNLKHVRVTRCKRIQTLFPAVLAENLKMLETLEVTFCDKLEGIVGKEEDEATGLEKRFSFPQLTLLAFEKLLEFTYFFPELFTVDFPKLNLFAVLDCPKFEVFHGAHPEGETESISTSISRQPLIPNFNAISILEELYLDWKHISVLRSGLTAEDLKYLKCISLLFNVDNNEKATLPIEIIEKVPKLQELELSLINSVEIFLTQNTNGREHWIQGQLKILTLLTVSELQYINLENSWLNTVIEKLYNLNVIQCPDLNKLFRSPCAVSFSCMKELYIRECHGLEYLFTCSVAKVLATLEKITVMESKSIIEIVAKEQNGTTQEVKFERLCHIVLNSLTSLECFYSGNETLQLPVLTQVDIWQCPNVEVFSQGEINAESFRGIQASTDSKDQLVLYNNDLNASVKRIFLLQLLSEGTDVMKFSKYPELKEAWHDEHILQHNWFYNLTTLKLINCDIETYAIPSNILPCLMSLKELEVRNCNKVKVIFSIIDTDAILSQLINLTLEDLSELTLVWEQNFQGILKFQYLQQVSVIGCKSIKTLFPTVLAENLNRLEKLEVKSCDVLEEIVEKEEVATGSEKKFWFPRLTSLDLNKLQELTYFYPEIFTVECPELDHFSVLDCPKLKLFQGAHPEGEAESVSASNIRRPFIPNWCFCNLISLVVEGCEFLADALLPSNVLPFLSNLKTLEVCNCNSIKAIFVNTKIGPQGSLGLPFLEKLCVENCKKLLEIVAKEEAATKEANEVITVFLSIKFLKLWNLHNLRCIFPEVHILEWPMMQVLDVTHCPQLNFFTTEFQSSQDLHSECPTIPQAFVSLEKVTPRLKELSLGKEEANMMEQGKLHVDLQELCVLRLQCFYDETDVFPFIFHSKVTLPCTDHLVVRHSAFKEIFPTRTPDVDHTKILSQLKTLELLSLPELESIGFEHSWIGPFIENLQTIHVLYCACLTSLSPSTVSFSKLETVIVQNCDRLKYLFTSSTAKTLSVLKKMILVNCESIIEIVAKEGDEPNEGEMPFMKLSILTLGSLPKLGSFYSGSFTLNFSSLKEVSFTQCNNTKVFRIGDKVPGELKVTIDGVIWESDKNEVIMQHIDEEA